RSQAHKMLSLGSRIRSFWSGLQIDKVRQQIAQEKEQEFSALHYSKKVLEGALEHEQDRRRDAERRANVLSANLREMRDDLVRAHAKSAPKKKSDQRRTFDAEHIIDAGRRGMRM